MSRSVAAALGLGCLLLGCDTTQRRDSPEAARAYIKEVTGETDADLAARAGGLQITTTDVTTDGRIAKMRGKVSNRYGETVEGVRYLVTIYDRSTPPKVLQRVRREVDTTLAPGQRKMMSLDVESMYFGMTGGGPFTIEASPVTLAGREVPPPEGWDQAQ